MSLLILSRKIMHNLLKWIKTKTSNRESELAFGVLILIITNVFIAIAIVAILTKEEMCQNQPTRVFLKEETTSLWSASIKVASEDILIGSAAVISEKWVLTSASCIEKIQKWTKSKQLILVDSYEESHKITKIVKHKNIDLALLKVDVPFYPEQLITYGFKKSTKINDTTLIAYSRNHLKKDPYEVLKINIKMGTTKNCSTLGNPKKQVFFCGICSSNDSKLDDFGPGGFLFRDKHLIGVAISKSNIAEPCIFINISSFTSCFFNNTSEKIVK